MGKYDFAACSILATIIACGIIPGKAVADMPQAPIPQKFNCVAARNLVRQGDAAQTAGDGVRSVHFWQQAIESYELCDNATVDDHVAEAWTMTNVAAQFQDEGELAKAHSMYNSVGLKSLMLCAQTIQMRMNGETETSLRFTIMFYRKFAEPMGLPSLDEPCNRVLPRPSTTP